MSENQQNNEENEQELEPFPERLQNTLAKEQKMWNEQKIGRRLVINFPNTSGTPVLGKIGKKLIELAGGSLDVQFIDRS